MLFISAELVHKKDKLSLIRLF